MATNARDIEELLARGEEQRGVEFKPAAPRSAKEVFAKVARAMMAMANKRDGGRVLVGVTDAGQLASPELSEADARTWRQDELGQHLAAYADPRVDFDVEPSSSKGGAWS